MAGFAQEGGGLVDTEAVVACAEDMLGYQPRVVHLVANSLAGVWHDIGLIAAALHAGTLASRSLLLVGSLVFFAHMPLLARLAL